MTHHFKTYIIHLSISFSKKYKTSKFYDPAYRGHGTQHVNFIHKMQCMHLEYISNIIYTTDRGIRYMYCLIMHSFIRLQCQAVQCVVAPIIMQCIVIDRHQAYITTIFQVDIFLLPTPFCTLNTPPRPHVGLSKLDHLRKTGFSTAAADIFYSILSGKISFLTNLLVFYSNLWHQITFYTWS